jgi:hypothetical protein
VRRKLVAFGLSPFVFLIVVNLLFLGGGQSHRGRRDPAHHGADPVFLSRHDLS